MDLFNLFQYATALILVLALALVALIARRYGNNPEALKQQLGGKWGNWKKWEFKAPEKRLAVVETLMLGPKQRLLIIRRDNVEHLVMMTADSACVVETNLPACAKTDGAPTP